jgi:NAD(P)H dehydrogenase (quinone)
MQALLVYAHPEPRSFNAGLRDIAIQTLQDQGYDVEVSDLYAMNFDAVAGRGDFTECKNSEILNLSLEQRHAAKNGTLTPLIAQQLEALQNADLLILHFPLWWFGMPAILKGWIDRVFVSGVVYGRSAQFERGKFLGKRALVCTTTGAPEVSFTLDGINGDMNTLLMPLLRGVLGFTGMTVLPPFVGYAVPYIGEEARQDMLISYGNYIKNLELLTPLPMPRLADHPEIPTGHERPQAQ